MTSPVSRPTSHFSTFPGQFPRPDHDPRCHVRKYKADHRARARRMVRLVVLETPNPRTRIFRIRSRGRRPTLRQWSSGYNTI